MASQSESKETAEFVGSVLGAEWDDRVGAGAGPSSIVSIFVKMSDMTIHYYYLTHIFLLTIGWEACFEWVENYV